MTFAPAVQLASGFQNKTFDSQRAFRAAMEALANPGRIRPAGFGLHLAPLPAAAAALVLALCDFETPLYLGPSLVDRLGVSDFLRFHTDAMIVAEPTTAAFALVDMTFDPLDLSVFAQGTPEYPDRSTTVICIATSLTDGRPLAFTGPGIANQSTLQVAGLPQDFAAQWQTNRANFPLGVDLLFADADSIVGLPRSARMNSEKL